MSNHLTVQEPDLQDEVIHVLAANHLWWTCARRIGLECGFDLPVAAKRVQPVLKRLVKRGFLEENRNCKPIIYKWKS